MTDAIVVTDSHDKKRLRTLAKWSSSRGRAAALFVIRKEAELVGSDMAITSKARKSHCWSTGRCSALPKLLMRWYSGS